MRSSKVHNPACTCPRLPRSRSHCPPLAEQHRIVARVEEVRSLCADLRGKLTEARITQTALADALVATVGQQVELTTDAGTASGPN